MNPTCPRCKTVALKETDQFCYACGCSYTNPTQVPLRANVPPVQQMPYNVPHQGYSQGPQYIIIQQAPRNSYQAGIITACIFGIIGAVMSIIGVFMPFYEVSTYAASDSEVLFNSDQVGAIVIIVWSAILLIYSLPFIKYCKGDGVAKMIVGLADIVSFIYVAASIYRYYGTKSFENNIDINVNFKSGFFLLVFGCLMSAVSGIILIATAPTRKQRKQGQV